VYVIVIGHELIGRHISNKRLLQAAFLMAVGAVMAWMWTPSSRVGIAAGTVAYQVLVYGAIQHHFRSSHGRELEQVLGQLGVDREYYVDWNYWSAFIVLRAVPPVAMLAFLGLI